MKRPDSHYTAKVHCDGCGEQTWHRPCECGVPWGCHYCGDGWVCRECERESEDLRQLHRALDREDRP